MKKAISAVIMIALLMFAMTTVNAATPNEDLKSFLSGKFTVLGEEMTVSDSNLLKLERYLADHELTAAQVSTVKEQVNDSVEYINSTNATDLSKLTTAQKQEIIANANTAAEALDLTISVDSKSNAVNLYEDGKKIDALTFSDKLMQTGGNSTMVVVLSSLVAIIAIAGIVYVKRNK